MAERLPPLPPLPALRAFEAAARLGSFRQAAEALSVTQSAISHRVRTLESFIGRPMFRRGASGIALTEEGRRYLAEVAPALDRLRAGTEAAMGAPAAGRLRLRSTPGIANRWLTPRLGRFAARHPEVAVDLVAGMPPASFAEAEADVLIHWGADPLEGADIQPFFASRRVPVASPALFGDAPPPERLRDFAGHTLIHDIWNDGWDAFVAAEGGAPFDHRAGPRFAHCDLVLTAVEAGQGIALCYEMIAHDALAAGRVIRLGRAMTPPGVIYSLATARGARPGPAVEAFAAWIMDEAGRQERALERTHPMPGESAATADGDRASRPLRVARQAPRAVRRLQAARR